MHKRKDNPPMPLVEFDPLVAGVIAGQVVSFPTDTVPALAVRPDRSQLIFTLKGRSLDKPLILMGASPGALWPYTSGSQQELEIWQQVAQQHWPGQLTLVLPASQLLPTSVNPLDPTTIGIRIPDCATALEILARTGPLATTSANRSGEPPLTKMAAIADSFPEVLALNQEESDTESSGVPSTVAKWTETGWKILRQGKIHLA